MKYSQQQNDEYPSQNQETLLLSAMVCLLSCSKIVNNVPIAEVDKFIRALNV